MSARFRREGERFIKQVGDEADGLIARTRHLVAAGLPTPEAMKGPGPGEVAFAHIEGESGRAALKSGGDRALVEILRPLARLHQIHVAGLETFNPKAKIVDRLNGDDDAMAKAALARAMAHLDDVLRASKPPVATLHGDFHVGQVLRGETGEFRVLDLDDLALGPVEADLGNFTAHLATDRDFAARDLEAGYLLWIERVTNAYPRAVSLELTDSYCAVALLRRGLKLREREGDARVLEEVCAILLN